MDYPSYDVLCREHPEIALQFVHLILHRSSDPMKNIFNDEN